MRLVSIAIAAAGLTVSAAAQAAPLSIAPIGDTPTMVDTVHLRHSSCQRGPAGWHYHFRGDRIACQPRPTGRFWGWTLRDGRWGWWHSRERRWH